nr:hypothetical protein [Mycolicibacterium fluoranthenivorans]
MQLEDESTVSAVNELPPAAIDYSFVVVCVLRVLEIVVVYRDGESIVAGVGRHALWHRPRS